MDKKILDLTSPLRAEGFSEFRCQECGCSFYSSHPSENCGESTCDGRMFLFESEFQNRDVVRELFMNKFTSKGFEEYPPATICCDWRGDVFFTQASIYVFQPRYTGGRRPPVRRACFSQPCLRLNDLENLGEGRHCLLFEMMTHTAFNHLGEDYGVRETLSDCLEFLRSLGIPGGELRVKISEWEGGGNSGPCYEVFVAGVEVATLVFMTGPGIRAYIVDTGYGLCRICSLFSRDGLRGVLQGPDPEFEHEEFEVIRAIGALLREGIHPVGKGRGSYMRALVRRAVGFNPENCESICKKLFNGWAEMVSGLLESEREEERRSRRRSREIVEGLKGREINREEMDELYESRGVLIEHLREIDPGYNFTPQAQKTPQEKGAQIKTRGWYSPGMPLTHDLGAGLEEGGGIRPEYTSFYAGGGGQDPDSATINGSGFSFEEGEDGITFRCHSQVSPPYLMEIDPAYREDISGMHTALHVLAALLEEELGMTLTQIGSAVSRHSSRMDFNLYYKPNRELLVSYSKYLLSREDGALVRIMEVSREEFERKHSASLLKENTPNWVRTFLCESRGLRMVIPCGGTHLRNLSYLPDLDLTLKGKGKNRVRLTLIRKGERS